MSTVPISDGNGAKVCTKCGLEKPLDEYYVKEKSTGRRFSRCKPCHTEGTKANHRANREREAARQKAYRLADLEKARRRDAEYREKNRETLRERERERAQTPEYKAKKAAYRASRTEERRSYNARYREEHAADVAAYNKRYYEENKEAVSPWSRHAEMGMSIDTDLLDQILAEVGDPNGTIQPLPSTRSTLGTIQPLLPTLWTIYNDTFTQSKLLGGLYVKRAALDVRMAEEQQSNDFTVAQDVKDMQSVRFDHAKEMRDATHAEIVRIEAQARGSRVPASGALTTVEPVTPAYGPDATDPRYTGSPYTRSRTW
jgi:hypothetical protein